MANLYPTGAQALSVSNASTSFTISGILLDLSDVLPGDVLCTSAGSAPILTVTSGGGTLGIGWQGATVSGSTAWWIERRSDQRYSGFYTATQAAKAAQRLAQALTNATVYSVKGETNTPPASPAEGDTYLTGTSPTGAWASNASAIARYTNGAWVFPPFQTGDGSLNTATNVLKVWNGATWASATSASITDAELLALAGLPSAANKIPYFTGSGTADLLTRDTDGTLAANSDNNVATQKAVKTYVDGAPIVILATGQSNFARNDAYSWTPPKNLAVWNWNGTTATVGTAFAALDGTTASAPYSFAARVAEAHPARKVYLLRIAIGAQAIAQWKSGAATPKVYDDCKANVEAALTLLGLSKIDALLWWQGEADTTSPANYITDFETVMTRFRGETWFPYTTPIVVFGLTPESSGAVAGFDLFNTYLQRCVYADPANRLFAYPGWATSTYWADNRHATGLGAHLIGIAAAQQFMGRAGARPLQGVYRNYGTGEQINRNVSVVTANASDPTAPLTSVIARDIAADATSSRRSFEGYGAAFFATFVRAEGTAAAKSAITSGLALGNVQYGGWDGAAWAVTAAVRAASTENWSGSARGTELGLWTVAPGATTLTQRWKVADAGQFVPAADNTYDFGTASLRPNKIRVGTGASQFDGAVQTGLLTVNTTGLSPALPITGVPFTTIQDGAANGFCIAAFGGAANAIGGRAGGSAASPTGVGSGATLYSTQGYGYHSGGAWSSASRVTLSMVTSEAWSSTAQGTEMRFQTTANGTTTTSIRWKVDNTGDFLAGADNTYNIGSASFRAKEIFAGTGTINTSDATEKNWLGALTEAEMRVARRLSALVGTYQWKASVEKKGDAARLHVGVTVQAVVAAFEAEGLDPWRYAMCCSDTFDVLGPKLDDQGAPVLNDEGQPIMVPTGEKHTRLGLRYDQLYAFVTAAALHQMQAINVRLAAIEAS